ncbi:MAG: MnmC family methyltransferase [Deltaproteobacteria bacterium]|nr:MnmC family methyltransferase [Deltaproteobacteria bacterium]
MNYELKRQPGGAQALFHRGSGETMHPGAGPWAEANALYLGGTGLEQKLLSRYRAPSRGPGAAVGSDPGVVVFDVGLGGAANALAALTLHQRLHHEGRTVRPLKLISFEQDPEAPRFALDHAGELGYVRGHEDVLEDMLETGSAHLPGGFSWAVRWGDFPKLILDEPERADVIFFDPFSPRGNPELWSLATLEHLYRSRHPHGELVLATYSAAYGVRAALFLSGFFAGEGPQPNPRRRTTIASTSFKSLQQPLGKDWLNRWRRDHEPWPPLTPHEHYPRLRRALLEHSQWEMTKDLPEGAGDEEGARRTPRRGGGTGFFKAGAARYPKPQPPQPGSRRQRARMRDAQNPDRMAEATVAPADGQAKRATLRRPKKGGYAKTGAGKSSATKSGTPGTRAAKTGAAHFRGKKPKRRLNGPRGN